MNRNSLSFFNISRQDKTAILGEISPIFRSFSAYFPPMVSHLPFLSPHVYGICLFPPISVYFPPIFCLKWYPILVINSSMEPIFCFSAHMFMGFAYFLFNLLPIFLQSCLARPSFLSQYVSSPQQSCPCF